MPSYRVPTLKNVLNKAWFRMREFVVEAWPLLIVGSAVLAILNYFDLAYFINWLVRPFTWVMGLPSAVGVPLIFGVLRKVPFVYRSSMRSFGIRMQQRLLLEL